MKKSGIQFLVREGSNPPFHHLIHRTASGAWCIEPWQEYTEGTRVGLYHFRLDVAVKNSGHSPAKISLELNWPHPPEVISQFLDFVYLTGPDGSIRRVQGKMDGAVVRVTLLVASGVSWISTNPPWHVAHNEAWFKKIRGKGGRIKTIGRTGQGRPIRAIEFGTGPKTALVAARMHPYESASSFCAAGIAEWLGGPRAGRLLREWRVSIVPLANPDGVAGGCTRLTGVDGMDLNIEAIGSSDPTAACLREWIDREKPDVFLNFHNWMSKTLNGLYAMENRDLWAFLPAFDRMVWEGRTWYGGVIGEDVRAGDPERQVLDRYCHGRYGTLCYILEFPWHGSTPTSLRRSGVRSLRAALSAFRQRR